MIEIPREVLMPVSRYARTMAVIENRKCGIPASIKQELFSNERYFLFEGIADIIANYDLLAQSVEFPPSYEEWLEKTAGTGLSGLEKELLEFDLLFDIEENPLTHRTNTGFIQRVRFARPTAIERQGFSAYRFDILDSEGGSIPGIVLGEWKGRKPSFSRLLQRAIKSRQPVDILFEALDEKTRYPVEPAGEGYATVPRGKMLWVTHISYDSSSQMQEEDLPVGSYALTRG